jgi:transporter family protein
MHGERRSRPHPRAPKSLAKELCLGMIDAKILALTTAIGFGLAPVLIKMAYRRGGTTGTGLILALVLAVVVNVGLIPFIDPHFELLTPAAFVAFVLGGLTGNAIGRRWSFQSIELLGASQSSAIRGGSPMVTALLAVLVYGEVVTPIRWAAIIAIVVGAVLVTWMPGSTAREWLGLGVLYAVGATVSYGIRPILWKFGLNIADTPLAAACVGSIAALLYALVMEDRSLVRVTRLDRSFWLFFAAAVVGAIAVVTLIFALAQGDVSVVYPLSSSSPLFAVAFSAFLLRGVEQVTWRLVVGSAFVVVGAISL